MIYNDTLRRFLISCIKGGELSITNRMSGCLRGFVCRRHDRVERFHGFIGGIFFHIVNL